MTVFPHYLSALQQATEHLGWQTEVMLDAQQSAWSYQRLLSGAYQYHTLWQETPSDAKIGLLLPNHPNSVACLFGVWLSDRSAAMLNITTGRAGISSACQVAGITTIVSQHSFLQAVGADNLVSELSDIDWIWLEDVQTDQLVDVVPRIKSDIAQLSTQPDDEAVVLFTSGSEGEPKGVSLSHRNLLVNIAQTCERLPFQPDERFFIALPMFHSFGLTVGCLLPLLQGFHVCLFPSPLMVKAIPKAIQQHGSTVLFGSSTFLHQWARNSDDNDFQSLRMVIAGAEKLQDQVRMIWQNYYQISILEGYGVTETSPVIAVNMPDDNRIGSVGKLVVGLEARLVPVEGLDQGGRLQVKGDNVMRGYYLPDRPAEVTPLESLFDQDGWYDTGDLADIDEQGFLYILGRVRRFAKIGGEMVSLAISEHIAQQLYPEAQHVAVAIPDFNKGERIVLFTSEPTLGYYTFLSAARDQGIRELMMPKQVHYLEQFPVLGSGKIDFVHLRQLAQAHIFR